MAETQIGSPMLKLRVPLILDPPDEAWFDRGSRKRTSSSPPGRAEQGVPLPTAEVADEILTKADQLGYTHRDIASFHQLLARLSKDTASVPS